MSVTQITIYVQMCNKQLQPFARNNSSTELKLDKVAMFPILIYGNISKVLVKKSKLSEHVSEVNDRND